MGGCPAHCARCHGVGRHEAGFAARPFLRGGRGPHVDVLLRWSHRRAAARNFVGRDRIVVSNVERQLGSGLHRRRHVLHCAVRLLSVLHRDLGGREQGERSEGSCKVDPLGHPRGDHAELLHVRQLHDNVGRGRG